MNLSNGPSSSWDLAFEESYTLKDNFSFISDIQNNMKTQINDHPDPQHWHCYLFSDPTLFFCNVIVGSFDPTFFDDLF